jgi:AcrR family transcriptional regulator
MTTDKKLVAAAAALLDSGGEDAVTLRAVGHAVGVSHNAPYKHFKDRGALLAAVAAVDFVMLTEVFSGLRQSTSKPTTKLKRALKAVVEYGHAHPARYRLIFSNPDIAAQGGDIEKAALVAFAAFAAIVQECQAKQELPDVSNTALSGLLYATMHGLIDLEASGRMRPARGLSSVGQSIDLMIQLLSSKGNAGAKIMQKS